MIPSQGLPAHFKDQNQEQGPWDSALERAVFLAETQPTEESYKALKELMVPFLARHHALATLAGLAARWDPEGRRRILELVKKWVEAAQGLEREEPTCVGPQVVSRTLADLFYRQGHKDEAEKLYKSLLRRNPQDRDTLREYQERFRAGVCSPGEGDLLRSLQEMLKRITEARTGRI